MHPESNSPFDLEVPIIEMLGITKKFPGVIANDHIDFRVKEGEIHALLGENGAGKTTLMNILYGIYTPDEGEIRIRGKRVNIRSPQDAIKLGIGMVHQHFMLIPRHTVAENILLGLKRSFFLNMREVERKILEFSIRYGLKINPRARVSQLSMGERQRVEIIRTLMQGAKILILDEPTSILTPFEVKELFKVLRTMSREGRTIIFVTHKLDEALSISDRITVLKHGKVVANFNTPSTSKKQLVKAIIGDEFHLKLEKREAKRGRVALDVRDLHVLNDEGLVAVKGVSFLLHEGEIYGIAGMAGNGQKELVEAITGLRKPVRGRILVFNEDVTGKTPRKILERGVAYIPEERLERGVVADLTIAENLIMRVYRNPPFSRGIFLNRDAIIRQAESLISMFRIVTPSYDAPVRSLSGGNIQRLIIAREISSNPRILIAVNPTRGLDISSTEHVHYQLLSLKSKGVAILLVSEDLDEILTLSDRIAVINRGCIVSEIPAEEATIEKISLLMTS